MALEAMPLQQDLFCFNWNYEFEHDENGSFDFPEDYHYPNWDSPISHQFQQWVLPNSSPSSELLPSNPEEPAAAAADCGGVTMPAHRQRKRRPRTKKNQEEIENQRMTHIAVERNRRKQMNDYLAVLRGLMPESYVQRGDQASIIGGAINYVKELEHELQFLSGTKHEKETHHSSSSSSPFVEFFNIPQYSTAGNLESLSAPNELISSGSGYEVAAGAADIEVTMVENHVNLKLRSKRRPKLLPRIISGIESLSLTVLHLNVTKAAGFLLCSLALKVEDGCKVASVDEIAAAVNQILGRIHEG
ncbi:PREDICTED: transcription factor bHLH96-like [Ipomoea nil]|uniref:transcription factor bHLH96-like n=1 Tax=Ipomoea nil TaxID=35883 RepID=UPI000900BD07|nr:PREDICTED: transcription factor bHLH96-like [Ipomoea nil]